MKINISVTGDVSDIELSITVNGESVGSEQPAEEQRDSALDALVIPADDRGPHELNSERRRDSYGYEGEDRLRLGFQRN